jgi:hypothetical protein
MKDSTLTVSPFGKDVAMSDEANEVAEFRAALVACLRQNHGFAGIPEENVEAEYSNALLGCGDYVRKFGLDFPLAIAYSGDTVRILQTEVLERHPRWTIILAPACSEVTFDRVTTNDGRIVDNVDKHLEEMRAVETDRRDRWEGIVERQIRWLEPRVPTMVKQLSKSNPFVIAGMFDSIRNEYDRPCICLLTASRFGIHAVVPDEPPTTSDTLPVSATGELYRKRYEIIDGVRKRIDAPYWLSCWVIPKEYSGEFIYVVNETDGTTTPIPYKRSEIIRDRDLPRATTP